MGVARGPVAADDQALKPMLTTYDYLVIAFYFVFMAGIGWICRKFITSTSEYFRGGGKMLWWMAGCSAFVVQFSAWTFTGAASKAYEDGSIIMVIYFANALGFFFNFAFFAPRFRQMRVVTSMQAVRARFGKASEQFFTWVQIPLGVVMAGIWLSGLSVFISAAFNMDLRLTTIVTGSVVVLMSVIGGSWAVVAGDFIQTLVLMPITIVTALLSIAQVGGWQSFVEKLPRTHLHWNEGARNSILLFWIMAFVIKQFVSTNNMSEASRYLTVKDSRQARKAALLAMFLFILGPIIWFIPPMAARILHPDLHEMFPHLKNPAEGAFVAAGLDNMPKGMLGLLISGIFGATMSTMDVGLNKNAGFFVKNFYQVVLRPRASDAEQLFVGKAATFILGSLVITTAIVFSETKLKLFDLMVQFGALISLPYSVPLIWGTLIKKAPSWAGWSTVLVGFVASLLGRTFLTVEWAQHVFGWHGAPLTGREQSDWALISGVFLNAIIGSAWFLGSCFFSSRRSAAERERVEAFFHDLNTPIDFQKEMGQGNDLQQYQTLGLLCLIYGSVISLLILIPNSFAGRLGMIFCAGFILGIGVLLRMIGRSLADK
jgi:Na+/proline symporter